MSSSSFGALVKKAAESGTSFDLLPAGPYVAKIIESEYKLSNGGKPQIKTRWEVVVGPNAGFKGLWNYFTLTIENPNAVAIFFRQLKTLGVTQEFLDALSELDNETAVKHIAGALEGRMAGIKVTVDTEYNNNKIDRINPVPQEFAGLANGAGVPSGPGGFGTAAPAVPSAPTPPSTPF
jgi:hypothetical protein